MQYTSRTDAELVNDYRKGDPQAIRALIDRHKEALYAHLLRYARNRAVAEDLAQEVFIKMIKKLPDYSETGKFYGWLMRIASNIAVDNFRTTAKRRERSLDTALNEGIALIDLLPAHEAGPDKTLEAAENIAAIRLALRTLSPEQAEVMSLHHFSSLSFKEISARTGQPIGTLLARMSRGRVKLRAQLAGRYKAAHI